VKLKVRNSILINLTFRSSLSLSFRGALSDTEWLPVDPLNDFSDIRGDTALTCSTIGLGSVGAFQAINFHCRNAEQTVKHRDEYRMYMDFFTLGSIYNLLTYPRPTLSVASKAFNRTLLSSISARPENLSGCRELQKNLIALKERRS
jgi:hypothetical protein